MQLITFGARFLTKRNALPVALALVAAAGIGDALTSADALFTVFYVVPIAVAAWFLGPRLSFAVVGLCTATSVSIDVFVGPRPSSWIFLAWNSTMELMLFVAFAYAIGLLRERVEAETELRRAALDQLRHAERLNTIGKLASGMAHELGTPLNVISGRADLISQGHLDLDGAKKSAKIISAQAERMATLVHHLLAFARRGGTDRASEDLLTLCRATAELLAPLAKQKDIQIVVRGASAKAPVNRNEISQVLGNLVANAVHAMPDGGTVEVTTEVTRAVISENGDKAARAYALLRVRDEGTGIAPTVLPSIFDPFFTTKEVGEGTGLGLSIVHGIVRDHGGVIRVESALGEGTTFSVYLPQ